MGLERGRRARVLPERDASHARRPSPSSYLDDEVHCRPCSNGARALRVSCRYVRRLRPAAAGDAGLRRGGARDRTSSRSSKVVEEHGDLTHPEDIDGWRNAMQARDPSTTTGTVRAPASVRSRRRVLSPGSVPPTRPSKAYRIVAPWHAKVPRPGGRRLCVTAILRLAARAQPSARQVRSAAATGPRTGCALAANLHRNLLLSTGRSDRRFVSLSAVARPLELGGPHAFPTLTLILAAVAQGPSDWYEPLSRSTRSSATSTTSAPRIWPRI